MNQWVKNYVKNFVNKEVLLYKADDFTLLHIFESKQHTYNSISIHHKTLNDCLNSGVIYLDSFLFL
jgi:hypothetical protein